MTKYKMNPTFQESPRTFLHIIFGFRNLKLEQCNQIWPIITNVIKAMNQSDLAHNQCHLSFSAGKCAAGAKGGKTCNQCQRRETCYQRQARENEQSVPTANEKQENERPIPKAENGCQGRINRYQAPENTQPVRRARKYAPVTVGGKTRSDVKGGSMGIREIMIGSSVVIDWLKKQHDSTLLFCLSQLQNSGNAKLQQTQLLSIVNRKLLNKILKQL